MCQQLLKVLKVELGDFIINKIFYCLRFGIYLDTWYNSLCPTISSYLSVSSLLPLPVFSGAEKKQVQKSLIPHDGNNNWKFASS